MYLISMRFFFLIGPSHHALPNATQHKMLLQDSLNLMFYPKYGSKTRISWNLLEMQNLGLHYRSNDSESTVQQNPPMLHVCPWKFGKFAIEYAIEFNNSMLL